MSDALLFSGLFLLQAKLLKHFFGFFFFFTNNFGLFHVLLFLHCFFFHLLVVEGFRDPVANVTVLPVFFENSLVSDICYWFVNVRNFR